MLVADPTLSPAELARVRGQLPVDLAYFRRWRYPGDTIAAPEVSPTPTDAVVSAQGLTATPLSGPPSVLAVAESGWQAALTSADRAVVVLTDNPANWVGLLPSSPRSAFEVSGRSRPALTRSFAVDLAGAVAGAVGPAGPYPAVIGAPASDPHSVASALAQAWVNATGATWRGR